MMTQSRVDTEAELSTQAPELRLGRRAASWLFALALVVLLPGIHVSLFDRDEGWYGQVSREMLESGDWLVPRYLGEVWLAKPPLTYWLVSGSFRLLGVGDWQARLAPVLTMAASVVLVGVLGARIYGRRVGFLAGVLFITAGLPVLVGKMLLTDQAMLLCTLSAIYLHWRIANGEGDGGPTVQGSRPGLPSAVRGRRPAIHRLALGYWLAIGLGILAKGPATLVFAGAFGLALLFTPGRRRWIANWRYWVWLPVAPMIAAPWYLHIAQRAGGKLAEQFLGFEILDRIAGTPHGHGGPPGYYLALSLAGLLPWTVFVPGTLIIAFRRRRTEPTLRLLLIWLAVPWLVLELVHSKLPHYVLPCYVPLMILLARMLKPEMQARDCGREGERFDRPLSAYPRDEQRVLRLWPLIMIGMGLAAIASAAIGLDGRWSWAAMLTGAVLIAGFLGVDRILRRSFAAAFRTAVVAAVAFQVVVGLVLLPALEPVRLSRNLARRINEAVLPGERVLVCGYEEPSLFFYLDRPARRLRTAAVAGLLGSTDGPVLLAMTQSAMEGWANREDLPPGAAVQLQSKALPVPVKGFNYVKGSSETVWLIRLTPFPAALTGGHEPVRKDPESAMRG